MSERCKHCRRPKAAHKADTFHCPRPSHGRNRAGYIHFHPTKVYEGVPHVCRCGCERTPVYPRRSWFSQECVDRYLMEKDQGYFRKKIFERDQGVCAECNLNTEDLEAKYRTAIKRASAHLWTIERGDYTRRPDREERVALDWLILTDQKYPWARQASRNSISFWQADHIHPKHLGGAGTLENGQTLCLGCHYKKTAKQRGLVFVLPEKPRKSITTKLEIKLPPPKPPRIKPLTQPAGSLQCGQTCVAMIAKRDRLEVCRKINRFTATNYLHLRAALDRYGFKLGDRITGSPKVETDTALCVMKGTGSRKFSHWIVWHRGRYYCPERGEPNFESAVIVGHFEVKKS